MLIRTGMCVCVCECVCVCVCVCVCAHEQRFLRLMGHSQGMALQGTYIFGTASSVCLFREEL